MECLAIGGTEHRCWYALRTRSRHEKLVRDRLCSKGVEPLLPLVRHISQWSDRKKRIELPLFAGYCFAKFSLNERTSVLEVPGVVNIVGTTQPEAIPEEEIQSLQTLLDSRLTYKEHSYFVEGALVKVMRGPLIGLTGQFVRESGQGCIVIRINLIQRAAAVHVNFADCAPAT
jgi:transcription antitermination factor NusG